MTDQRSVLDDERLDALRALDGGALLVELAQMFRRESPTRMEELRAAADAGDWTKARALAHRLRGTAANLGAPAVAAAAQAIEEASGDASIAGLLEPLDTALQAATDALGRVAGDGSPP